MRAVEVVGAGLAGCEAALQCARRGVPVRLLEMRPQKMTEAHETGDVAELVCSNSLKSDGPENAHGLLKAELRVLGSVLLDCAERARVPGGKALVVDRRRFSAEVQSELSRAGVKVERAEVRSLPPAAPWYRSRVELSDPHQPVAYGLGTRSELSSNSVMSRVPITVVATGPLTSASMADALQALLGTEHLFFYDAIAPIVSAESLDMTRVFEGSRYGVGSDYLNCPMDESEYDRFVTALLEAELHPIHSFERVGLGRDPDSPVGIRSCPAPSFFEGCLPVEEIARRGRLALAFGPMKPVGLVDTRPDRLGTRAESADTGLGHDPKSTADLGHVPSPVMSRAKRPFAVVQLRRENAEGSMFNLVGFQTRLRQGEQERVFRMIPGLERVTFLRFGSMHRNTFLDSPKVLLPTLQTRASPELLVAGQLTGVEGYVESIGAGLVAGINAARLARGEEPAELPCEMMMGSLLAYIARSGGLGHDSNSSKGIGSCPARFQPMNANFGLLPPITRLGTQSQFPGGIGLCPASRRLRGRDKRQAMAARALEAARAFALTAAENRA